MSRCVQTAAELVAAPVAWLWENWLPAGKLVLLDGDPGTGKSTLTCELAARLSRGELGGEPVAVLLINAEDGRADTTVPRLAAAGADLDRVHLWDPQDPLELPRDLDRLRAEVRQSGAKLVVIDPLSAHLGRGANVNGDQSARRALTPLARLAEELGCTILLVRHLRKQAADNALYRGLGSVGIIAAVRVAWLLGYHPGGEERRVLTMTKCNLGPVPASKVFRVAGGRVAWGRDEEWLTANEIVRSTMAGAAKWLGLQLGRGPRKKARLQAEAAAVGISERTLYRAKHSLNASTQVYYGKAYWCLPGQDPQARYGGLEPMDDVEPDKRAVLDPVDDGPVPDAGECPRLGPVEDGPLVVREGMSERQILRAARKVLKAANVAARKRGGKQVGGDGGAAGRPSPPRPPSPKAGEGGVGPRGASAPQVGPGDPAPFSPALGEGGRGGEGRPPAPAGSRRFDPAPPGYLDVVVRVDTSNPDWSATLIDQFFRFEELIQGRVAESAGLTWQPDWTGPLGDGRVRFVFVPREVPPDRVAGLAAWAHEALAGCESARLAA